MATLSFFLLVLFIAASGHPSYFSWASFDLLNCSLPLDTVLSRQFITPDGDALVYSLPELQGLLEYELKISYPASVRPPSPYPSLLFLLYCQHPATFSIDVVCARIRPLSRSLFNTEKVSFFTSESGEIIVPCSFGSFLTLLASPGQWAWFIV